MFNKKTLLPLMLLILALLLTACTTDTVEEEPAAQEEMDQAKEERVEDENGDIKTNPEEAFDIYMEKHPTSKVKKVQLEKEMGKYVYSVEGFEGNTEYEIEINPMDGSITKEHTETDKDMDDREITRASVEKVQALVDKALAEAGEDASLEEWTIEMDDAGVELEIEIDQKGFDKRELTYNVETGELVEMDD